MTQLRYIWPPFDQAAIKPGRVLGAVSPTREKYITMDELRGAAEQNGFKLVRANRIHTVWGENSVPMDMVEHYGSDPDFMAAQWQYAGRSAFSQVVPHAARHTLYRGDDGAMTERRPFPVRPWHEQLFRTEITVINTERKP